MPMVNGAPITIAGRVAVDTSAGAVAAANAGMSYMPDGALACSLTAAVPTTWQAGLGFIGLRLSVKDILGLALPAAIDWNRGKPLNSAGQLLCSSTAAVAMHNNGWPQAANGVVCIQEGAAPRAFSSGFDTGFQ